MIDYQVDHSAFHNFCKEFDPGTVQDDEQLDAYLNNHPEVITAGCDDIYSCSSTLLMFPHTHMGVTVVMAPQCTSDRGSFFLYPEHIDGLIASLQKAKAAIGRTWRDDMNEYLEENK